MNIDILCLGTPKLMGDAFGPMVGTMLLNRGLTSDAVVYGTLEKPVTKSNYEAVITALRPDATLIVVDAALANRGPVPSWTMRVGKTTPGASGDSDIDPIGDISVRCYLGRKLEDLAYCKFDVVNSKAAEVTTELLYLINNNKIHEYIEENSI